MTAAGHVISDLHLFAHRSVADSYMNDMHRAAAASDFFVLNGDIFDFRWSTLATVEDSLEAAIDWLRTLVASHPACRFFYTLGNHDCYEPFIERLAVLAMNTPNLQWYPSHFWLGSALFLHGDLPLARRRTGRATRTFHDTLGNNSRTRRMLYRSFVAVRGHRLVASLHRPRRCAKRITRWLDLAAEGSTENLTDVYFGHTHLAFSDFDYSGLRFHNTGAAIRGLSNRILAVRDSVTREHLA